MPIDADLRLRVQELVSAYLDGQSLPGDLSVEPVAIRSGTAVVCVRLVDVDPPFVRVFSPLLRGIARSPELLVELNDLNGKLSFLRLFWRDDTVYAACELMAATLTRDELSNACDLLADTADYYDAPLRARFGGEIAFAGREQSADAPVGPATAG